MAVVVVAAVVAVGAQVRPPSRSCQVGCEHGQEEGRGNPETLDAHLCDYDCLLDVLYQAGLSTDDDVCRCKIVRLLKQL